MTPPSACTVRALDTPVDSKGSEPHTGGPAEEMGLRRKLRTVCKCRWVPVKEHRGGALGGSQQSQGHGHKSGADEGWEQGVDTEEGKCAGHKARWLEGEALGHLPP